MNNYISSAYQLPDNTLPPPPLFEILGLVESKNNVIVHIMNDIQHAIPQQQ